MPLTIAETSFVRILNSYRGLLLPMQILDPSINILITVISSFSVIKLGLSKTWQEMGLWDEHEVQG